MHKRAFAAGFSLACLLCVSPAVMAADPGTEDPNNWPQYNRTTNAWRYSPLDQINKNNVGRLSVAWIAHGGDITMGIQETPLAIDGVIYSITSGDRVAERHPHASLARCAVRRADQAGDRLRAVDQRAAEIGLTASRFLLHGREGYPAVQNTGCDGRETLIAFGTTNSARDFSRCNRIGASNAILSPDASPALGKAV